MYLVCMAIMVLVLGKLGGAVVPTSSCTMYCVFANTYTLDQGVASLHCVALKSHEFSLASKQLCVL